MSEELIAELNRQGVDLSEKTIAEAAAQQAPVQIPDLKDAAAVTGAEHHAARRLPSAC